MSQPPLPPNGQYPSRPTSGPRPPTRPGLPISGGTPATGNPSPGGPQFANRPPYPGPPGSRPPSQQRPPNGQYPRPSQPGMPPAPVNQYPRPPSGFSPQQHLGNLQQHPGIPQHAVGNPQRPLSGPNQPYPQRPSGSMPVPQPQTMNNLSNQMDGMSLAPPSSNERTSKPRQRYANDPSLAPAVDMAPPNYGHQGTGRVGGTGPQPAPLGQGGYNVPPVPIPGSGHPDSMAQKPRIDPNQAPSVVDVQALDQQEFANEPFYTLSRTLVPRASSDFCAVDNGNANPKFLRLTAGNLPVSRELADSIQLPLALVIQPLAELRPDEVPIPEVDCGPEGPLRCTRCKGYINPSVVFISGGRKYICNLCRFENEVPEAYFCNLDMNGRRLDADHRPELKHGSVEFVATEEFCHRPPTAASIVFAIDVSWSAIQNGTLLQATQTIQNVLYGSGNGLSSSVRFGIITFDRNVHVYNLNPSLDQAQMLIMSDANEPFVPLSEGFLVDPYESRHVIEPLLSSLPSMFGSNRISEAALGAALQCAQLSLNDVGGRIFAFQSTMPSSGIGSVKPRDNIKAFGTDKEKPLFESTDPFYEKLGEACVTTGVSVDLFITTNTYVDIATIGTTSYMTNGSVYFYPGFTMQKNGFKLNEDLCKLARRTFGCNGVLRVRCSDGILIDQHLGNFFMRNSSDVELACIDSEKTVTVILQHEGGKLDEKLDISFQVALLYTRSDGQRRIRMHNLSVPVTTLAGNLFKYADVDCLINVMGKMAVSATLETNLKSVRERLTERCVRVLTAYRQNCAQGTPAGQLILPENLKLLPVLTNSLLKTQALRSGMDVSLDLRLQQMKNWKSLSVNQSIALLYPRLAALHTMTPDVGSPDSHGRVLLPTFTRLSYPFMDSEGAYLLENGHLMQLWLGRKVDPNLLSAVFGVNSLEQVDSNLTELPRLENPFSEQVHQVIQELRRQRAHGMPFSIVRQQLDASEVSFANLLVEDKNLENPSYIDYLCLVHRNIQTEVNRS